MTETTTPQTPAPSPLKQTTLYSLHKESGAKFVDFHGWELPIQFESIVKEHEAVRTAAGLFDVSHMGQLLIEGPPAFAFIQRWICSDLMKVKPGHAVYTHILNDKAGVVDDVIIYCLGSERFFMVTNAANSAKVYEHLKHGGQSPDLMYEDASHLYGMLALQGPKAAEIMKEVCPEAAALPHFGVVEKEIYARNCLIGRTGYTGEDGFEIIAPEEVMTRFWQDFIAKGRSLGIAPCGLGARDTLRLEAGLLLHGSDIDETRTPLEAGQLWLVALDGPRFAGKEILEGQMKQGLKQKLIGVKVMGGGVPRAGCKILYQGKEVGALTSGTFGPTVKAGIGMGYASQYKDLFAGAEVAVVIHDKPVPAMVYPPPFYRRPGAPKKKHA